MFVTTQIDHLQMQPIFNKAGLQLLTRSHFERLYSNERENEPMLSAVWAKMREAQKDDQMD